MPIPDRADHSFTRSGDLRVAALNPWQRYGDWPARRAVLVDGLAKLQPDLMAFVEVVKTDDYDQTEDLLGPGHHLVHQRTGLVGDGVGISIASRWPVARVHEVDLHLTPRTAGFNCMTLAAEVVAPEPVGPLLFLCTNPNWQLRHEHERERQAVATARFVEALVDTRALHVVLAGDFDATPDAASMRFWRGRQSLDGTSVCYRDAWQCTHPDDPGHTFTPANPLVADAWDEARRIDYVLVRCGDRGPTLDVTACARIFDQAVDGVWASDHFGVTADLAVPARSA
jgi:endonuclease/exonuclease/phosphatase family metal-dependent hydrolase